MRKQGARGGAAAAPFVADSGPGSAARLTPPLARSPRTPGGAFAAGPCGFPATPTPPGEVAGPAPRSSLQGNGAGAGGGTQRLAKRPLVGPFAGAGPGGGRGHPRRVTVTGSGARGAAQERARCPLRGAASAAALLPEAAAPPRARRPAPSRSGRPGLQWPGGGGGAARPRRRECGVPRCGRSSVLREPRVSASQVAAQAPGLREDGEGRAGGTQVAAPGVERVVGSSRGVPGVGFLEALPGGRLGKRF